MPGGGTLGTRRRSFNAGFIIACVNYCGRIEQVITVLGDIPINLKYIKIWSRLWGISGTNWICIPSITGCAKWKREILLKEGPKNNIPCCALLSRQVCATFAWCTRATWRTSYAKFARNSARVAINPWTPLAEGMRSRIGNSLTKDLRIR
jgi:hypothetical protein